MTRLLLTGLVVAAPAGPAAAAPERTRCTADPVGRAVCFVIDEVLP